MTLTDYNTAETIRAATIEEWAQSILASERDGGAGVIRVDGVSVYVEGEPVDLAERIEALAREEAAAGDLDGHALYTSPDGARAAVVHIAGHVLA
jgi:hypothetical protein